MKEARLPVKPSTSRPSSASLHPRQQALPPAAEPLNRSPLEAVPNCNGCLSDRLHARGIPDLHLAHVANDYPMQTFFRIRLYRKMFDDFARQELASSPISTLDDLGSCTRCFERLGFA